MKINFEPINKPYMYGFEYECDNGIVIEAVRCYAGEWDVFLTRDGAVCAVAVKAYRQWQHSYTDKQTAMQVARELAIDFSMGA